MRIIDNRALFACACRSSCGSCGYCGERNEQLCSSATYTYNPDFGGYATSIQVPAEFAFPIPDDLPSDFAGTVSLPVLLRVCRRVRVYRRSAPVVCGHHGVRPAGEDRRGRQEGVCACFVCVYLFCVCC